jgi:hypothetical protein
MSEPNDITADLKTLFRAVKIRNAMEYEIGGRIFNLTNPATHPQAHGGGWSAFTPMLAPLVADMQLRLYDWAYCRRMQGRVDAEPRPNPALLLDKLSAANVGRERWEHGWRIAQLFPNGGAQAQKGGRAVMFEPGHYNTGGAMPHPGAAAAVFLARESKTLQPGFYYVMSETVPEQALEARPTRIYFHIDEEGAPLLVTAISRELNRFGIPFRFKTLSYSGSYIRSDSAVLFFAKRYFPVIARLLPRIREAVKDHLRPATPLFTRKLGDGLGLAEDPGNGESFGSNRARLVAQAIWDAHVRGLQSEEARLQELDVQFQQHGLRLDRPHLRAGSVDLYELAS